ncbi:MAG: hypothetical protein M3N53_04535 [Actinomycetota bacterium]|nr:hypothetical protein [Actinomycetota bacterium]
MTARKPVENRSHQPSEGTRHHWRLLERRRWIFYAPFFAVGVLRLLSQEGLVGGVATFVWGSLIVGALYWLWAYQPGRKLKEGTIWSGLVALHLDAFTKSPSLRAAAPPRVRGGAFFADGWVHGRLALSEDEVSWVPVKTSRWGGAKPWSLPLQSISSAETGEIPGYLGAPGWRGIYQALQLNLADGVRLPMYVTGERDLTDALVRLGIPSTAS